MMGDPFVIRKNRSSFHRDPGGFNVGVVLIVVLTAFGLAVCLVSRCSPVGQPVHSPDRSIYE
jgi:hypothetical protein